MPRETGRPYREEDFFDRPPERVGRDHYDPGHHDPGNHDPGHHDQGHHDTDHHELEEAAFDLFRRILFPESHEDHPGEHRTEHLAEVMRLLDHLGHSGDFNDVLKEVEFYHPGFLEKLRHEGAHDYVDGLYRRHTEESFNPGDWEFDHGHGHEHSDRGNDHDEDKRGKVEREASHEEKAGQKESDRRPRKEKEDQPWGHEMEGHPWADHRWDDHHWWPEVEGRPWGHEMEDHHWDRRMEDHPWDHRTGDHSWDAHRWDDYHWDHPWEYREYDHRWDHGVQGDHHSDHGKEDRRWDHGVQADHHSDHGKEDHHSDHGMDDHRWDDHRWDHGMADHHWDHGMEDHRWEPRKDDYHWAHEEHQKDHGDSHSMEDPHAQYPAPSRAVGVVDDEDGKGRGTSAMPPRTPNNDRNNPRWNAGLPRSPPTAVNPKRLAKSISYSNDASGRAIGTNIKQSTMVVFIGIVRLQPALIVVLLSLIRY